MKNALKKITNNMKMAKEMTPTLSFRTSMLFMMLLFFSLPGFATISSQLNSWYSTVDDSLTIVVGIYAVVGGFLVFIQYMQGNQEAQKNLIKFVIGLAVFGIAKVLVNTFTEASIS